MQDVFSSRRYLKVEKEKTEVNRARQSYPPGGIRGCNMKRTCHNGWSQDLKCHCLCPILLSVFSDEKNKNLNIMLSK